MTVVALTIDTEFNDQACRGPLTHLGQELELLGERDIKATFFVQGAWAEENPDRFDAIKRAGHHIGIHGYEHVSLESLSQDEIAADLCKAHDILLGLGVETRPWFRAPFGATGSGRQKQDMAEAFKRAGYKHVPWDADGGDWNPKVTVEDVVAETLDKVRAKGSGPVIMLFHSWPDKAPEAMRQVLDRLEGAEYVTVPDLLPASL